MSGVSDDLKRQIVEALGENLVCILLTGSRIRGEEAEESDYDLALIVREAVEETLQKLRRIFLGLTQFSLYLLDQKDLETLPKAAFLQFVHSEELYGDFDYPLPSEEDAADYVHAIRRDMLDRTRHYLILPHSREKLASVLRPALKYAYLCLSYLIFNETSRLPSTRKETKAFLKERKTSPIGLEILNILENWDACKQTYFLDPIPLLFRIETFLRELEV